MVSKDRITDTSICISRIHSESDLPNRGWKMKDEGERWKIEMHFSYERRQGSFEKKTVPAPDTE